MSISTVIVAPSVLLREGIASLLQGTRYKVVGCTAKPAEISPASSPKGQPSLAIIGIDLQNATLDDAAASAQLLRPALPDAKVVLVAEADRWVEQQMPLLSFDACIFSLCSRDTLIKVLELTSMNQRVFVFAKSAGIGVKEDLGVVEPARCSPPVNAHEFTPDPHGRNLSPRETQVLTNLAEGKSNKVIARICHISEATVKVHLKAILRKTKAHNRTQAAIWAIQHGVRDYSDGGAAIERLYLSESPALAPIRPHNSQGSALPRPHTHLAPSARYASASNASKTR